MVIRNTKHLECPEEDGRGMKRITVVTGHYGSGKTEFSMNLALQLAAEGMMTSLVDLDIANVYFRSREHKNMLEEKGVHVYGNAFDYEITAELPALSPSIRAPFENMDGVTVVDAGGNDSGARIINQFSKYLTEESMDHLFVINGNRPETSTVDGCLDHLNRIVNEIQLPVNGLVNNTHMLSETTIEDLRQGMDLTRKVAERTGIPLRFHCYVKSVWDAIKTDPPALRDGEERFFMTLYHRPQWLDR